MQKLRGCRGGALAIHFRQRFSDQSPLQPFDGGRKMAALADRFGASTSGVSRKVVAPATQTLNSGFNDIRVRSFIRNGATLCSDRPTSSFSDASNIFSKHSSKIARGGVGPESNDGLEGWHGKVSKDWEARRYDRAFA
jgi:hypothetical protein